MIRFAAFCLALTATASGLAGDGDARMFPDLSSPKAAAFSMSVALATGEKDAAKAIYAGSNDAVPALIEALAALNASADKLAAAATDRFGRNAATLDTYVRDTLPKLNVGQGGRQSPLSSIIATAEVEQRGNKAVLSLTSAVSVRLERRGNDWRVTEWPAMPQLVALSRVVTPVYDQIAEDIRQGRYEKAYEVWPALAVALQKQMKESLDEGTGGDGKGSR